MGSCSSKSSSSPLPPSAEMPSGGIDVVKKSTASSSADAEKHPVNHTSGEGGSTWSQLYSAGVMRVNEHYTKECECGKFYRNN